MHKYCIMFVIRRQINLRINYEYQNRIYAFNRAFIFNKG